LHSFFPGHGEVNIILETAAAVYSDEVVAHAQVLNLFLALLLSSFGAESLKHSQEDSEPNKLQEAVDRINRLVIYIRSKLVQLITERYRNTHGMLRVHVVYRIRGSIYKHS